MARLFAGASRVSPSPKSSRASRTRTSAPSPPPGRARLGRRGSFQLEDQLIRRHNENLSQRDGDEPGGAGMFGAMAPNAGIVRAASCKSRYRLLDVDLKAEAKAWWRDFQARGSVFHHQVWYISAWDWLLALFVLYSTAYTPFILVFPAGQWPGSPGLDVTIDILFMLDVGIKLRTTCDA